MRLQYFVTEDGDPWTPLATSVDGIEDGVVYEKAILDGLALLETGRGSPV